MEQILLRIKNANDSRATSGRKRRMSMSLKTKLITSASMFFLVVALLVVGVWAVSTAQVTMGGTISFNATNIYATITGTIEGASNAKAMTTLEYSAKTEPSDTAKATWCQDLTFANATIPTIKWTITIENKSERALYVSLTDNITSLSNATKTLTFAGSTYTSGEKEIPAKTSKVFTMEIKVDDTNASATVDYDFDFGLRDENQEPETPSVTLEQDANGYFVYMGQTSDGTKVKWRLVGHNGNKFTGSTAPTSGYGTFILETYVSTENSDQYYAFDSSNNDYATSDIRTYLTNEDTTGYIQKVLGITASDEIYSAIDAREISDLYTEIGWATGNVGGSGSYAPPAGTTQYAPYSITPSATGSDKLWLMSVKEIYTMVGGGTLTNGTIPSSWASDLRTKLVWNDEFYWLRSPFPSHAGNAFSVGDDGDCYHDLVDFTIAVRPAFNLNF